MLKYSTPQVSKIIEALESILRSNKNRNKEQRERRKRGKARFKETLGSANDQNVYF